MHVIYIEQKKAHLTTANLASMNNKLLPIKLIPIVIDIITVAALVFCSMIKTFRCLLFLLISLLFLQFSQKLVDDNGKKKRSEKII